MFLKKLQWDKEKDLFLMARVLQEGKVIAGDSDTIPGLLSLVGPEGRQLLDSIKGRSLKPYIVLIAHKKQLVNLVASETLERYATLIDVSWPGPVTLIFLTSSEGQVLVQEKTVAVRMPAHAGLQELITRVGPVYSTSANKAGQPFPEDIDAIEPAIKNQVALLIEDVSKELSKQYQPSAILDCTGQTIRVVRDASFLADLEKRYGQLFDRNP